MSKLFSPIKVGSIELLHKVAMAPLTRQRASERLVPNELNKIYYKQRASEGGLIISEATVISKQGVGYPSTPGIFTEEQISGWKNVTDAVHEKGGYIFCQLWHCGRSSHPDFHFGELPVSSGDINPGGTATTYNGVRERVAPRPLRKEEIANLVNEYADAAENAIKAGFDGVEIHGANGYLIDQFICDGSNNREDEYGGSIKNRIRFALEVVESVSSRVGADRTGIRLSPSGVFNGMSDSTPIETFGELVMELNKFELAYLHVMEPYRLPGQSYTIPDRYLQDREVTPHFRKIYKGILMTNCGYTGEEAKKVISDRTADIVAFGKDFISNPDLPERIKNGWPLQKWNSKTFYGGDDIGYIDYPFYNE
ncbi:MAG: alkene reductase [Candidatus Kapaibacteriales bacterium]